jgi:hypothetical protein
MRQDEKKLYFTPVQRMVEALKVRGVGPSLVDQILVETTR